MKILITGGCGFIGSNIADYFVNQGHHIILFDNLLRPNVVKNLMWLISRYNKIKFLQYDIRNTDRVNQVIHDFKPDVIFHFAAQTAVTASVINPKEDFEINALGTFNILEAIRTSDKKPYLVFASTNKVYGEFKTDKPVNENQPLSFSTPYGCSKGAADQYVLDFGKMYDFPVTVLRMSCIYGNRQFGTEDQGWICHFMRNRNITVYGDGSQIRDVLYIDDYVRLCKMLIDNQERTKGQVFNIGGGIKNSISVNQVLDIIGKRNVTYANWRPNDQRYYVSDLTKIIEMIGWKPQISINEGFERLKKWVSQS